MLALEEWNKLLLASSSITAKQGKFLLSQQGIVGNSSGIVSIKSTEFGRLKYKEDSVKVEEGYMSYETQKMKTSGGLFSDKICNYSLVRAWKEKKRFLVFQGKNDALVFEGLGEIIDINPSSDGSRATCKIYVNRK